MDLVYENKSISLDKPGGIILRVMIPTAEPAVNCFVSTRLERHNCKLVQGRHGECEVKLSFEEAGDQEVVAELTFIALKPSLTTFYVKINSVFTLWIVKKSKYSVNIELSYYTAILSISK